MRVSTRRLQFVSELRTDAWISRASGIPASTIGYVRRGERELPREYYTTMRNLYQRESYRELREQGFSSHQARRFSSYAPEAVTTNIGKMKEVIEELATGRAGSMADKYEKEGIWYDPISLYDESVVKIREGIQRSHEPMEEIERYTEETGA